MRRLHLFIILTMSTLTMLLFQNCAQTGEGGLLSNDSSFSTGSLKVSSSIQLNQIPTSGTQNSLQVNRSVNPQGLDFGPIPSDFTYPFPYHLDLASGQVFDNATRAQIAQLSAAEESELAGLLENSILANSRDFLDPDILCASVMVQGYAKLQTDQGDVLVGSGNSSCDIIDLYKDDGSGQNANLKGWLEGLEGRLPH